MVVQEPADEHRFYQGGDNFTFVVPLSADFFQLIHEIAEFVEVDVKVWFRDFGTGDGPIGKTDSFIVLDRPQTWTVRV